MTCGLFHSIRSVLTEVRKTSAAACIAFHKVAFTLEADNHNDLSARDNRKYL